MNIRAIILVPALVLGAVCLRAQEAEKPAPVTFEAQLAFDVTSNTGVRPFYDVGAGFNAGVFANVRLPRNFFFEPGVLAYFTAWSVDNDRLEALKLYSGSARNWGVRIPLNFGYTVPLVTNLVLQAYTGPWLNVNVSARQTLSPAPGSPFEKYYNANLFREGFKRVDAQWGFGLKLTWSDHYVLGVSFGVAMTPLRKFSSLHNEMTQRRNSFQINLGYKF